MTETFHAGPNLGRLSDVTIIHGDCIEAMAELAADSVDAVVCDPPYGLGFMGKAWDALPPGLEWARECLRVLKPGGHLLAFGGTRTWHRLAVAVEDAGFEIRDSIAWLYGSGFPKSLDVSKAIDKMDATDARRSRALRFTEWMRSTGITSRQIDEVTGTNMGGHYLTASSQPAVATVAHLDMLRPLLPNVPQWVEEMAQQRTVESENYNRRPMANHESRPGMAQSWTDGSGWTGATARGGSAITPEAAQWSGWGTALKPAFEPVVVARKPLVGTVAANVLAHGTGALNIDACRIDKPEGDRTEYGRGRHLPHANTTASLGKFNEVTPYEPHTAGRWPANVVLDADQAAALDEQSGTLKSGANPTRRGSDKFRDAYGDFKGQSECIPARGADSGGASRFFLNVEPDPDELEDLDVEARFLYTPKAPKKERPVTPDGVSHPTVKPLALMRWLVRLVTPPGGVVLDPFAGSGTTVEAALLEDFRVIGIEREVDYLPMIQQRIARCLNS